ncbi:MAG TPA: methylamine methyltransferase corrinoid protein reductive activase [Methanomassiliicoccales archaeon]|jgi:methylamine methyltransferase corrinoid protein reductive activase
MAFGLALDLGTSGYRSHLVDLSNKGRIVSTTITMRHPLPGANIMDHLHFWLENGSDIGHQIIAETVDRMIEAHGTDHQIDRIAVCGNPAQVSMFQNIEVRDLAYAGHNALKRFRIDPPERNGCITTAGEVGLKTVRAEVEVIIPPSIRHEIGADALAMIIKSGLLEKNETCMVTDYGTNAEMGLYHNGELYTGSAAAGPAMEGQSIKFGMLASPGAISDFTAGPYGMWYDYVLDADLHPRRSTLMGLQNQEIRLQDYTAARGITGTGVVGAVALGIECGLIRLPRIRTPDGVLHFQNNITFGQDDLTEAGKAMGAIRAGHRTLIEEVGMDDSEINAMYLAGASGTYVDPIKAQMVGMVPQMVGRTVQVGNTSLMMAYDLVTNTETLDMMRSVAHSIASKHIMFATSKTFETLYTNELAFWTEGMDLDLYNQINKDNGLRPIPSIVLPKETSRVVAGDIPVLGDRGLNVIENIGVYLTGSFPGCNGCGGCQKACPENALHLIDTGGDSPDVRIATDMCLGTACKKCQRACPKKIYRFNGLKAATRN